MTDPECDACVGTGAVQTVSEGPPTFGFANCAVCTSSKEPALVHAADAVCEEYGWGKSTDDPRHNRIRQEFGERLAIAALIAVRDGISDSAVDDGVQATFGMDEKSDIRRAWTAIIDSIIKDAQ